MDPTLAQILNKLYELQLENQQLSAENGQLRKAVEAIHKEPPGP